MSDAPVLASLREAVYHVTGLTMKPSETYHVAMFLIAAGWTRPDTEGSK